VSSRAPQTIALSRDSIADQIYRTLRSDILNGAFEDGERLVQHAIADRMGTSRIPVRDALKRLEGDGLVVRGPQGGLYCKRFGERDLEEIYTLRALLEPLALRLAAPRLEPEALSELSELIDAMNDAIAAGDAARYLELNREFHMTIYEACDQTRLIHIIQGLWSGRPLFVAGDLGRTRSAREHAPILTALRAGRIDEAETLLRDHVLGSLTVLRGRIASRRAS
jgi:DNA-binding GntR family transcriptional regulator